MNTTKRILIIDDEPYLLKNFVQEASLAGYETTGTMKGREGFHLAKSFPPDVILLGSSLPDSDGIELCKRIKVEPELMNSCVILLLSGNGTPLDEQTLRLGARADDSIIKPISNRELLGRVQLMLRLKETEQRLAAASRELRHKNALLLAKQEQLNIFDQKYQETMLTVAQKQLHPPDRSYQETARTLQKQLKAAEQQNQTAIQALQKRLKASEQQYQHNIHTLQEKLKISQQKYQDTLHILQHQINTSEQNYQDSLRTLKRQRTIAQQHFQELADFFPAGYCTLDTRGTIIAANLKTSEQLRTERTALLKTPFSEYIVDEDVETFFLHLKDVFETDTRQTCQIGLFRQDGSPCFVLLESVAIRGKHGSPELCRTILSSFPSQNQEKTVHQESPESDRASLPFQHQEETTHQETSENQPLSFDICTLKHTEEQLRIFTTLSEQLSNVVVITNAEGMIEHVNPQFSRLTGYRIEEVIGKTPNMWKGDAHPPQFYQDLWKTIRAGHIWRGELEYRKKNGEFYWESASITPIKNADGEITHFLKVAQEIPQLH